MSKMNHRRGGKGARRGKRCKRQYLGTRIIRVRVKKRHRRALRRAYCIMIREELNLDGDRCRAECARLAFVAPRVEAAWIII